MQAVEKRRRGKRSCNKRYPYGCMDDYRKMWPDSKRSKATSMAQQPTRIEVFSLTNVCQSPAATRGCVDFTFIFSSSYAPVAHFSRHIRLPSISNKGEGEGLLPFDSPDSNCRTMQLAVAQVMIMCRTVAFKMATLGESSSYSELCSTRVVREARDSFVQVCM